jgi:DNA-binding NtrC family response regulator/orotate phosphoribosyltransferase
VGIRGDDMPGFEFLDVSSFVAERSTLELAEVLSQRVVTEWTADPRKIVVLDMIDCQNVDHDFLSKLLGVSDAWSSLAPGKCPPLVILNAPDIAVEKVQTPDWLYYSNWVVPVFDRKQEVSFWLGVPPAAQAEFRTIAAELFSKKGLVEEKAAEVEKEARGKSLTEKVRSNRGLFTPHGHGYKSVFSEARYVGEKANIFSEEIIAHFRRHQAIQKMHVCLLSGKHSGAFIEGMAAFGGVDDEHKRFRQRLARQMASLCPKEKELLIVTFSYPGELLARALADVLEAERGSAEVNVVDSYHDPRPSVSVKGKQVVVVFDVVSSGLLLENLMRNLGNDRAIPVLAVFDTGNYKGPYLHSLRCLSRLGIECVVPENCKLCKKKKQLFYVDEVNLHPVEGKPDALQDWLKKGKNERLWELLDDTGAVEIHKDKWWAHHFIFLNTEKMLTEELKEQVVTESIQLVEKAWKSVADATGGVSGPRKLSLLMDVTTKADSILFDKLKDSDLVRFAGVKAKRGEDIKFGYLRTRNIKSAKRQFFPSENYKEILRGSIVLVVAACRNNGRTIDELISVAKENGALRVCVCILLDRKGTLINADLAACCFKLALPSTWCPVCEEARTLKADLSPEKIVPPPIVREYCSARIMKLERLQGTSLHAKIVHFRHDMPMIHPFLHDIKDPRNSEYLPVFLYTLSDTELRREMGLADALLEMLEKERRSDVLQELLWVLVRMKISTGQQMVLCRCLEKRLEILLNQLGKYFLSYVLFKLSSASKDLASGLERIVRDALSRPKAAADLKDPLKACLSAVQYPFHFLVRRSLKDRLDEAQRVAGLKDPVLIYGETGTGKTLVANYIHQLSEREGDFVDINCGSIPSTLIASELFGHVEGAFTGATEEKPGLFEKADRGTLFLDELDKTPPELQASLLKVLDKGEIRKVGGVEPIPVDVRVICAVNQDPIAALFQDAAHAPGITPPLRLDLFYRLNYVYIMIPPLRDRLNEMKDYIDYFINKANADYQKGVVSPSPDMIDFLRSYSWPGNYRELDQVIRRAVLNCAGATLLKEHLPPHFVTMVELDKKRQAARGVEAAGPFYWPDGKNRFRQAMEEYERRLVQWLLDKHKGNVTRAVEDAGISRKTLYEKMKKMGIRRT